jgi:DNA-binding SARP family transcriptional activator
MATLEVYLFGRFCVRRDGQVLECVDARKVQELFSYLLLHRDDSLSREVLASALWPDTTTAQSKKYLRKTLWQLQSTLGSQTWPIHNRVLLVQPERVQLNSEADLWFDVDAFEQAFASVQKIVGRELNVSQVKTLQHAAELSQKPLLEDWYEDWCLRERERLQMMYLVMLDKLMDYSEVHHEYESGLFYGIRILYHERTRESTHRRLMRLHYLAGDRASALRQYEHCVAILDEDFGIKPSKPTTALYKDILADQLEELPLQSSSGTAPERNNQSLLEVVNSLMQLQVFLTDLQHQVQQQIQQVAPLLRESQEMHDSSTKDASRDIQQMPKPKETLQEIL